MSKVLQLKITKYSDRCKKTKCWEIGPSGLEPPTGAKNRRKATVKIRKIVP